MNLCAQLQVDLARLKLFQARSGNSYAVTRSYDEAQKALAGFQQICAHLHPLLGPSQVWVYPSLANGFADLLPSFPLSAVLASCGYPGSISETEAQRTREVATALRDGAKHLARHHVTSVLHELADHLRRYAHLPISPDEGLYARLSKISQAIGRDTEAVAYHALIRWSKASTEDFRTDAQGRLYMLLQECAFLQPGAEILGDLLQRMERLIYVPLVFDNDRVGIAVPIEVEPNFAIGASEPLILPLSDAPTGTISALPAFRDGIRAARERATALLADHNLYPSIKEFQVTVRLPRLHLKPDGRTTYDQGSLTTPVALALFCQNPEIQRSGLRLNPEVVATGPIRSASLGPKQEAFLTVGEVARLLVTSNEPLNATDKSVTRVIWHSKPQESLRLYLTAQENDTLKWRHSRIVSFGEGYAWDHPLRDIKGRTVATKAEHLNGIADALGRHAVVQLEGIPGIGKSVLLAQWLSLVQDQYDLVLHTSLPDYPDSRLPSRWAPGAFNQLASRLYAARGLPELANRLRPMAHTTTDASAFADAIINCLSSSSALWVIDNSQVLLTDSGVLVEPILRGVTERILSLEGNHKILFVTNQRITTPDIPSVILDQRFSFEDACWYLERSGWRYPALLTHVARLIGAYPRALAILAGHGADYRVPESEIQEILQLLPAEQGDEAVRRLSCERILGRVLQFLVSRCPSAADLLKLAATFIRNFEASQLRRLLRVLASYPVQTFHKDLDLLRSRNLVHSAADSWWMHTVVRQYLQDNYRAKNWDEYQLAHIEAGKIYFPLTKQGRAKAGTIGADRERYSDSMSCSTALFHFEQAEYDQGVVAVARNSYETRVERAKWLIEKGHTPSHPLRGYVEAERILGELIAIYDPQTGTADCLTPGTSAPGDVNALYARALHRQRKPHKYLRAAEQYRQAVHNKGLRRFIPALISVLCDIAADAPSKENPFWLEASALFESLSQEVRNGQRAGFTDVGEAYEKVARYYVALAEPELAAIVLEEAAAARTRWDRIYLLRSQLADTLGTPAERENWLLRGMEPDIVPQSGPLWIEYYLSKARTGKTDEIAAELRLFDRGVKVPVKLSSSLLEGGWVDLAKECLHDALAVYPESGELWERLCSIVARTGKPKKVVNTFRRALQRAPVEPKLYTSLAQFLELRGKRRAAELVYRRGIQMVPQEGILYVLLGKLFEHSQSWDAAEAVYRQGLTAAPDDGSLRNTLGFLLAHRDRYSEAESVFEDAIDDLGIAQSAIWLARNQERQGKLDEAAEAYARAIALGPKEWLAYVEAGRFYERTQRSDEALRIYASALTQASRQGRIHVAIGRILESKGCLAQAGREYEEAVEREKDWSGAYRAKARLQLKNSDITGALQTLQEALTAVKPDGYVYCDLASIHEQTNEFHKADEVFLAGLKHVPQDPRLYQAYGKSLERRGRLADAEAVYRRGYATLPARSGWLVLNLMVLLEGQGRIRDAEEVLTQAVHLYPNWSAFFTQCGEFYRRHGEQGLGGSELDILLSEAREHEGKYDEAESVLQNALSISAHGPLYVVLGQFFEQRGKPKQAEGLYRTAIQKSPRHYLAYTALGALLSSRRGAEGGLAAAG